MTATSGPADRGQPGGAPRVHLHIGTMKSGTSYLQHILERQQDALAELGVRYPGGTGPAVNDALGRRGTPGQPTTTDAWAALVADVRSWTGASVVISMEFLCLATEAQVERIVASLRPSQVRVVLTVRDIGRTVPSAWQQTTKNRGTTPWPDFVAAVMATAGGTGAAAVEPPDDAQIGTQFWRHHDVVRIAERWARAVGPAGVTVVTVPPAGEPPERLWERFAAATGIDAGRVPPIGGGRGNPSLGHPEAELLRRLNARLGAALDAAAYRRLVTGVVSRRILRAPGAGMRAPVLPTAAADWATRHGERVRTELAALGVGVVGDLDDLVPRHRQPASGAAEPPHAEPDHAVPHHAVHHHAVHRHAEPHDAEPDRAGSQAAAPGVVSDAELAATAVSAAAALVAEIAEQQARRRGEHAPP